MITMRPAISLIAFLCATTAVLAQEARWRSTLGPVERSGHYLVLLSPEVVGRSQPSLNDIRIMAPDSTLVPTLLRTETAHLSEAQAVAFTVLRNEQVGNYTVVEFEVPAGTLMDGLELGIRNAEVRKSARITGSDDRQHWFMVKDEGLALSGSGPARSLRWLDLPLSDHRYYRIALNDSLTAPVQVLSVGHTVQARSEGRYVSAGAIRWDRREEKGRTVLRIYGDHPLLIDRIQYATADTTPFIRQARMYTQRSEWRTEKRRRKVLETRHEDFGGRTLASYQRRVLEGPGVAVDTLFMVVENGDDRPISITDLEVLQLERSMHVRLEGGTTYALATGDPFATAPRFDIAHFRDSLPTPIDTLRLQALVAISPSSDAPQPFDLSGIWLWVAILVIGGGAAFGAVRVLRKAPGE